MSTELKERSRRYVYPDRYVYVVQEPVSVRMFPSDRGTLHEVTDKAGILHAIQPGWRILTVQPLKKEEETSDA